ncbi:hypothetical protein PFISCL1PPCAC_17755, partial [Pristionchus fissidentatus]
ELLFSGRCVKTVAQRAKDTPEKMLAKYKTECGNTKTFLPIVKNDMDNDGFDKIAAAAPHDASKMGDLVLLGVECDAKTHRLRWMDGSAINYTKNGIENSRDCTKGDILVSNPDDNKWEFVSASRTDYFFSIICATAPIDDTTSGKPCGDEYQELKLNGPDEGGPACLPECKCDTLADPCKPGCACGPDCGCAPVCFKVSITVF